MVTPTQPMRRGRLPAQGLSPHPTGVDDLKRMKRPHPDAGTPYRSSCRRASTTHGPSTKVRLGATHQFRRALPRVTTTTPQEE
jgi:hypothetical protein